MANASGRIHVLGLGNLGLLYAHSLAKISSNPPSISLLMHRRTLLSDWETAGRKIEITTHGFADAESSFEVEDITSQPPSEEPIDNLIVTTKTTRTKQAIESVKHRLGSGSTLLFCQNGMGTIEEVASLFPNQQDRPNFLAAITKHGVYSTGPFKSVHAGLANITIGHVDSSSSKSQKSQYLVDKIIEAKVLAATQVNSQELFYLQLEKLAINTIINPLTALYGVKNGELLEYEQITKLMEVLLQETCRVIQALPETREAGDRFSKDELLLKTVDASKKTAGNTSSMLQDSRANRETEIDYINGWIVKKGHEHKINVGTNELLVDLIRKGSSLTIEDTVNIFPAINENRGT